MNVPWMIEQTERFRVLLDDYFRVYDNDGTWQQQQPVEEKVLLQEPVFRRIMEALGSTLVGVYQRGTGGMYESRWRHPHELTISVLGVLNSLDEVERNLAPQGPQLHATSLHPMVWDTAKAFLSSGFPAQAVEAAANAVDAMVKAKVGRSAPSGVPLMRETFSPDEPTAERPRLRFPGDRASETWKARQSGARDFSAGCYAALRNPASHTGVLGEQEGLEQLAAFSLLARWVDECTVEAVS